MFTTRYEDPKAPATERVGGSEALLLCTHGGRYDNRALMRQTRRLSGRGPFTSVAPCSLYGRPNLEETVSKTQGDRLVVVPLLMAEGHTYDSLRARVERLPEGRSIELRKPVGTHPAMARGIARGTEAHCRDKGWPPRDTTLLLIGHGTPRHPGSGQALEALSSAIAEQDRFAEVVRASLVEEPLISTAIAPCRARYLVAVGCFAEAGDHGAIDVPAELEALGRQADYLGPIGQANWIDEIVLARADDRHSPTLGP